MRKTANNVRQPLTDEVLNGLADLAKVSEDEQKLFFDAIREAVDLAWERHALVTSCATKKSIRDLEKIASALYRSLHNLDKSERKFIGQVLEERSLAFDRISGDGGLLKATYEVAHLFSILTGRPPPSYPHLPARRAKRGRPSGSVDNWILHDFVLDLVLHAQGAGGRLPLDANNKYGALIWAVELLGSYLPVDLAERQLSPRTLRRLNEMASAIYEQACALEGVAQEPA
jgi:hypothetical protein